jgi:SWI/SNF-related matrix-associated actin-dependent regulator of chromatin subfamily A-like protein 1
MFSFDSLLPEGLSLFPYQTTGVATALLERKVIIGDELGLGKSVQALVATEALDAYPAVIVCPASLRANWVNEINKFLPHREAFTATGKPGGGGSPDFTIISYSLLYQWLEVFQAPQTVILDESHNVSNAASRRTRAALVLTSRVPENGLIMSLTGTPFVNKPIEMAQQLRLIGRLHDFTPAPEVTNDERAWTMSFSEQWCDNVTSLRHLHRALSGACYIRRLRKDVLGRDETLRNEVWLTLDLSEYKEAESDLISYLTERDGPGAAASASNAIGLSKLAHLRRLAGLAKIWAARHWIDNFFESDPDRSLVAYAYHKDVQQALVDHYQCAHILGGERDVEEQKRQFQSGESKLIICSSGAAREGHTLTRANDVVLVEPRWVPMDQEEGRINRLGQIAENTFAWYLLGADTVDERVWKIIDTKRTLFRAGAEGRGAEEIEASVAAQLIDSYRHEAPSTSTTCNIVDLAPRLATITRIRQGA